MQIRRVKLINFLCYEGEREFYFTDGLNFITSGKAISNGVGKTSLLKSIPFCFYKKKHAFYKNYNTASEDFGVEVELSDGTLLKKDNMGFWINGTLFSEAQYNQQVKKLIGLDENAFSIVSSAIGGSIAEFLDMPSGDIKKFMFSNFFDIDAFEYYYEKAKVILGEINARISLYTVQLKNIESQIRVNNNGNSINNLYMLLDSLKTKLKNMEHDIEAIKKELVSKEEKYREIKERYESALAKKIYMDKTYDLWLKAQESVISLESEYNALEKELLSLPSSGTLSNRRGEIKAQIEELQKKLHSLMNIELLNAHVKCPFVDEACPAREFVVNTARDKVQLKNDIISQIKKLKEEYNNLDSQLKHIISLEKKKVEVYTRLSHYREILESFNPEEYNAIMTDFSQIDAIQKNIHSEISSLNSHLNKMQKEYYTTKEQIIHLENEIKNLSQVLKTKETLVYKLDRLNQNKKDYNFVMFLLSDRGIKLFLLNEALNAVLNEANKTLESFGMQIYGSVISEDVSLKTCPNDGYKFKKGDDVCPKCGTQKNSGLNIEFSWKSERGIPLSHESTGRKVIYALALRNALFSLLKPKLNTMILDEILGNLDDYHKRMMVEYIYALSGSRQILLTDHNVDLLDAKNKILL